MPGEVFQATETPKSERANISTGKSETKMPRDAMHLDGETAGKTASELTIDGGSRAMASSHGRSCQRSTVRGSSEGLPWDACPVNILGESQGESLLVMTIA